MFKYSEKDLYNRCGYDKNSVGKDFKGDLYVKPDESKIPTFTYEKLGDSGLSRGLVLKTSKGYIPVDRITKFSDILDDSLYLKDETLWIIPYLSYPLFYSESIFKFAVLMGKNWEGIIYKTDSYKNNLEEDEIKEEFVIDHVKKKKI